MHIIWKGKFRFHLLVSPVRGQQVKIQLDQPQISVDDFVISGPGEYEIKDIFIQGLNGDYLIEAEGMRICYLGNGDKADEFGQVDILLVPADKAKLVSQVEPRLVIPMGEGIAKFLKDMGSQKIESQPKLLIKKKDLPPQEATKIVILKP